MIRNPAQKNAAKNILHRENNILFRRETFFIPQSFYTAAKICHNAEKNYATGALLGRGPYLLEFVLDVLADDIHETANVKHRETRKRNTLNPSNTIRQRQSRRVGCQGGGGGKREKQ